MPNDAESFKFPWSKESPFEKLKKEQEKEGYAYAGQEYLTETKFHQDARFLAVPVKTKEQIVSEQIKKYKEKDKVAVDVKLVDVEGLSENQQAVYIFIRLKK
jgi:hypothetical protein